MIHDSHSHPNANLPNQVTQWRCPNCGQTFFNFSELDLPVQCAICRQKIVWQQLGNQPKRWRCPNCGQILFTAPDDLPPDMCDYCRDFTTWIRVYA